MNKHPGVGSCWGRHLRAHFPPRQQILTLGCSSRVLFVPWNNQALLTSLEPQLGLLIPLTPVSAPSPLQQLRGKHLIGQNKCISWCIQPVLGMKPPHCRAGPAPALQQEGSTGRDMGAWRGCIAGDLGHPRGISPAPLMAKPSAAPSLPSASTARVVGREHGQGHQASPCPRSSPGCVMEPMDVPGCVPKASWSPGEGGPRSPPCLHRGCHQPGDSQRDTEPERGRAFPGAVGWEGQGLWGRLKGSGSLIRSL